MSRTERDIKDRHHDLVRNMPIELGELVQTVDKIQQQENDAEQHDAAADETVAQIAEQYDRRLSARDMRAGRYDQCSDDHLLDVRKYFLGDGLDMFGIERQPFGSDLRHGISSAMNGRFTTAGPRPGSKKSPRLVCG